MESIDFAVGFGDDGAFGELVSEYVSTCLFTFVVVFALSCFNRFTPVDLPTSGR